jgi:hypothetical protein
MTKVPCEEAQSVPVIGTLAVPGADAGVGVISSDAFFAGLYRPCSSMYSITGSGTRYLIDRSLCRKALTK